jgi:hypothetical protein
VGVTRSHCARYPQVKSTVMVLPVTPPRMADTIAIFIPNTRSLRASSSCEFTAALCWSALLPATGVVISRRKTELDFPRKISFLFFASSTRVAVPRTYTIRFSSFRTPFSLAKSVGGHCHEKQHPRHPVSRKPEHSRRSESRSGRKADAFTKTICQSHPEATKTSTSIGKTSRSKLEWQ